MGASREFCRNYFVSACGACEQTRGCVCVRHSSCGPALPAHLMDADDFAVYLSDMDDNLLRVRGDIDKLKLRYRELTADGFMGSSSQDQLVRVFALFSRSVILGLMIIIVAPTLAAYQAAQDAAGAQDTARVRPAEQAQGRRVPAAGRGGAHSERHGVAHAVRAAAGGEDAAEPAAQVRRGDNACPGGEQYF
jgi:hypothetical protein